MLRHLNMHPLRRTWLACLAQIPVLMFPVQRPVDRYRSSPIRSGASLQQLGNKEPRALRHTLSPTASGEEAWLHHPVRLQHEVLSHGVRASLVPALFPHQRRLWNPRKKTRLGPILGGCPPFTWPGHLTLIARRPLTSVPPCCVNLGFLKSTL